MLSRLASVPLAIEAGGRAHLLVGDRDPLPEPAGSDRVRLDRWSVAGRSDVAQGPGKIVRFRASAQLLERLAHRLAAERVGLRLYAAGADGFLADVCRCADQAGLGAGELFLERIGAPSRRVRCVHCRTVAEAVSTTLVACAGCGATLLVRDHFSRRLGAYMGVQVDAEAPGLPSDALVSPEPLPS